MSDEELEDVFQRLNRLLGLRRGGRPRHYILRGHEVLAVDDFMLWAMWYEDGNRIVKQEQIGDYWVSTVFLGLDHNWSFQGPPIVFETMIFIDGSADAAERYSTWDEAAAGHEKICERLREAG